MNTFDYCWHITLAECKKHLMACENYGYGLDRRKIKKNLPTIHKTVQRHKEEYHFWLDLYTYKLLRHEGIHEPLYVIGPQWEQDIAYHWWNCYFSYSWRGAKADLSEIK